MRGSTAVYSGASEQKAAEVGFAKENAAGIPLNAAERNYKDPNHKPELVFALTPFLAMNAFREFSEIATLLAPVADANPAIGQFIAEPTSDRLSALFAGLLDMQGDEKAHACVLATLKHKPALESHWEPWDGIRLIAEFYPDDSGLFSPLLLNVVQLLRRRHVPVRRNPARLSARYRSGSDGELR
ncbi:type I phosphomannose isomerase catalytic subunit [Escherichia coli]